MNQIVESMGLTLDEKEIEDGWSFVKKDMMDLEIGTEVEIDESKNFIKHREGRWVGTVNLTEGPLLWVSPKEGGSSLPLNQRDMVRPVNRFTSDFASLNLQKGDLIEVQESSTHIYSYFTKPWTARFMGLRNHGDLHVSRVANHPNETRTKPLPSPDDNLTVSHKYDKIRLISRAAPVGTLVPSPSAPSPAVPAPKFRAGEWVRVNNKCGVREEVGHVYKVTGPNPTFERCFLVERRVPHAIPNSFHQDYLEPAGDPRVGDKVQVVGHIATGWTGALTAIKEAAAFVPYGVHFGKPDPLFFRKDELVHAGHDAEIQIKERADIGSRSVGSHRSAERVDRRLISITRDAQANARRACAIAERLEKENASLTADRDHWKLSSQEHKGLYELEKENVLNLKYQLSLRPEPRPPVSWVERAAGRIKMESVASFWLMVSMTLAVLDASGFLIVSPFKLLWALVSWPFKMTAPFWKRQWAESGFAKEPGFSKGAFDGVYAAIHFVECALWGFGISGVLCALAFWWVSGDSKPYHVNPGTSVTDNWVRVWADARDDAKKGLRREPWLMRGEDGTLKTICYPAGTSSTWAPGVDLKIQPGQSMGDSSRGGILTIDTGNKKIVIEPQDPVVLPPSRKRWM